MIAVFDEGRAYIPVGLEAKSIYMLKVYVRKLGERRKIHNWTWAVSNLQLQNCTLEVKRMIASNCLLCLQYLWIIS